MPPIALTDQQLARITTTACQIPRHLPAGYLQCVAELLRAHDLGDGDVHRACIASAREVRPRQAAAPPTGHMG